jgi:hypothetical protein
MVVRLTTGRRVAGAVRYNECKVRFGQAVQLSAGNFAHPGLAQTSVAYKTKTLEHLTRRNPRVRRPCLHCALAFHPEETLSDEQLRRISAEFMNAIGYQAQPYLLYRHHDTAHPHVHVVTVSVTPDGRRISDAFLYRRVSRVRRRLEQRHGLRPAEGGFSEKMTALHGTEIPPDEGKPRPHPIETRSPGEAEPLKLLRLVERAFRELSTEPKGGDRAQVCLDDLILRQGIPAPVAHRAVELFLTNRKVLRTPPDSKTIVQSSPSPKRMPSVRRRLR